MGARQSKRSVDITTTPKKEGVPAEGGVGDAAAPGDGKLERIEEADTKPTTNGIAPHTDTAEDKEKDKDETTEKDKEQPQQEEVKAEETKPESSGDSPVEAAEVTTPTEATTPASPNTTTSPDNKETKKKDKKKKWSFRSISFSKKDKTKPSREDTPKNGDVTKEEPLAEGGEEAETAAASSPVEEKSSASSPSADEQVAAPVAAATESKEETAAAASPAAASPAEDKKEEPTPSAPTPVPSVEDKKEEEKVEAEKKVVEVSQSAGGQSVSDPVEVPVYRVQPVATPSIIERKTSEDLPSLPPSSPPPTPIDPSPLQQARQAAASATALAEALRLPAVAAEEETTPAASPPLPTDASLSSRENVPQESRSEFTATATATPAPAVASSTFPDLSADLPPSTKTTFVFAEVESPPVVETAISTSRDVATEVTETSASNRHGKEVAIEPKVESVSESPVTTTEEVSESQESEASRTIATPEGKQLNVSLGGKDPQSTDVERNVECLFVPKGAVSFIKGSTEGSSSVDQCDPTDNEEPPAVIASPMAREVLGVAMDEVMNEASPVVECQRESQINSCEDAMKINAPPSAGYNEKVEAGPLPSTEIETNGACSTVEQHLSSENFDTEQIESPSNGTVQRAGGSDSDLLSVERCADLAESSSSELVQSTTDLGVVEPPKGADVEKVDLTSPTELFINSEEGPLSVSEDILVEAKPAVVIPEDDSVDELTDTTGSFKVIPETDEEKIDNETEPDTALPAEEIPIPEEPVDLSVPKDAAVNSNEFADNGLRFVMKNEPQIVDGENALPSPSKVSDTPSTTDKENIEKIIAVSEELLACKDAQISLKEEQIALNEEQIALRETTLALIETAAPTVTDNELLADLMNESTTIKEELAAIKEQLVANKEEHIALQSEQIAIIEDEIVLREKSLIHEDGESSSADGKLIPNAAVETEQATFPPQSEQIEEPERCPMSPKNRAASPSESCPLDLSSSGLSDAPTCSLSEKHPSEPQTRVLTPESVPISYEDLPPAPEDTGAPSLDSFDYPLPPEELSCPLSIVIPPNASEVELPQVAPVKRAASPGDSTEMLLTPPVSPSFQSNVSIATGTAASSQIPSYDEAPPSEPNSYDQSDIKLTERLAAERRVKTESQDEALSCQLSNAVPSTATKEHHQKAPEAEAPVENNVAHDVSTTESADEAPKVAPPAVPNEAPASPPTAPAITEDVASVTKAIEEIDISDKAVAAAVNEAIECNTNEIIADAHHQNNINE